MNRRAVWILLVCLPLLLSGCGGPAPDAGRRQPLEDILAAALPDWDGLLPYPQEELYDLMDLDPEDYTECAYRVSADGLSAREAIALRAVDGNAAGRIADALNAYLNHRRKETRDYLPEAYQWLSAAQVQRRGDTVALIVGENAAAQARAVLAGE